MRFLKTNLVTERTTDILASSENLNFPASNLSNPFRSKRWRSAGSFEVGMSNNKIDFKETSGGPILTATINSGIYNVEQLKIAIKNSLQSVGLNLYTILFNYNTGIWSIHTNGSYLDLLNASGPNVSASLLSKSLGFAETDRTSSLIYSGSLIAIHTKESVVFDFKTIQDINSIVLLWPKEDGIRLSPNAIIKIEGNATNEWSNPGVSEELTVDNSYMVASKFFEDIKAFRFWRVTIEDPHNPLLFVELGMVWIGENVEFNEPENGFKYTIKDESNVSRTDFGHEYIDEYPQTASLEFKYSYVSYQTQQVLENAFRENGIRKPIIVVFNENESVFNRNHFLIYGKMESSFTSNHVVYNLFNSDLKITELG